MGQTDRRTDGRTDGRPTVVRSRHGVVYYASTVWTSRVLVSECTTLRMSSVTLRRTSVSDNTDRCTCNVYCVIRRYHRLGFARK